MYINVITLGCSKNLVDSESLLLQLRENGHEVFHDENGIQADVVIINTCGFILDAKEESIETILHFVNQKKQGFVKKVFVIGCLSERYINDLPSELPEVDAFFGVWDQHKIVEALGGKFYHELLNDRIQTTPEHYAFLKISEGCNRQCAFCSIPGIRGKQRSKTIEDLVEEAENLSGRGAKELILIAQDLTNYGVDLNGEKQLPALLKRLSAINEVEWIRLHYAYPTGFPKEVIDIMANDPKVCNYLDIPIQHINSGILHAMKRGHGREALEDLLLTFRRKVPNVAIRTTVLVGFPGESEEDFNELFNFINEFRFERLGVFQYSHEEDTPAFQLSDNVPEDLKRERADKIMELQQEISLDLNFDRIGETFKVIIDKEEDDYFIGRTEFDSPEVDNEVIIDKSKHIKVGDFVNVKITKAEEFDLFGEIVR